MSKTLTEAIARYDEFMSHLTGCTDGGCVIRRPVGMHTNGGCRCPRDHTKMQRAMYAANELRKALGEVLATQQPEPRDEVTDTERLDWLIDQQAWIQWTMRDGSIRQCQVYDQDEDENYHILSGDDRYFNTPREAIDAARAGENQ
ncbi:hypothetical protein [Burkholderia cenocepacia]|uniref:hypothetical protein n=1 Tax=Burkholderia cenocepacia TaxID=95486 RepID=UPI002656DCA0|nr:hypothetical protein [Burkholderia cenocepacia]MDN7549119.1 hypothetical protein [Burkholderia cenocepacia]